ncbi:hypothetical protein AQI84_40755 [Streptomyces griseorubiginosus]|nr:hypothetical protein AQI84_40755 [Streptomyces griseorubiginosus]
MHQSLHDSHGGETFRVRDPEDVMSAGLRRGRAHHGDQQRAARFQDLEQAGGTRLAVGVDGVRWSAGPSALPHEGHIAVQRWCFRSQLHSVGEEVVAEVLDGFPAVPFERTRLAFPRGWRRLAKGCHSKLHGKVEVVRGDGGLGEADIG